MTWADASFLGLGAALTALVLVGLASHSRRRRLLAEYLGGRAAMRRLSRRDLYGYGVRRTVLLALAGAALSVAMAEPRWVEAPPPEPIVKRIMLAIDVSASMQAEDVLPTRLGAAAAVAEQILDSLPDHEVGLLLFAGKAYPLAPPTLDHEAVRFLLRGVTPRVASAQDPGTLLSAAIGESLALLGRSFDDPEDLREPGEGGAPDSLAIEAAGSDSPSVPGQRIIVVIGDGDAGDDEEELLAAVTAARDAGVQLHAVGVGTEAGAGMVMPAGTYQLGGRVVDARGRPGVSRLQESVLREVATSGSGLYAHADAPGDRQSLLAALSDLGPDPEPTPDSTLPSWARYDLPFILGSAALALIVLESLLGMSLPRLGLQVGSAPRVREAA